MYMLYLYSVYVLCVCCVYVVCLLCKYMFGLKGILGHLQKPVLGLRDMTYSNHSHFSLNFKTYDVVQCGVYSRHVLNVLP